MGALSLGLPVWCWATNGSTLLLAAGEQAGEAGQQAAGGRQQAARAVCAAG